MDQHGTVVERGHPAELRRAEGRYASLLGSASCVTRDTALG